MKFMSMAVLAELLADSVESIDHRPASAHTATMRRIAQHRVDNTDGADGQAWLRVQKGVRELENSETSPVTIANVGALVFVEDDQTVAATGDIEAGVLDSIDDEGRPWVFMV